MRNSESLTLICLLVPGGHTNTVQKGSKTSDRPGQENADRIPRLIQRTTDAEEEKKISELISLISQPLFARLSSSVLSDTQLKCNGEQ